MSTDKDNVYSSQQTEVDHHQVYNLHSLFEDYSTIFIPPSKINPLSL